MDTISKFIFTVLVIWLGQSLPVGNLFAQLNDTPEEHAQKMAAGLKLFKSEVKPVLVGKCLKCHGGGQTEGEFNLSNRKALLAGGSQGPAVLIGKSKSSLFYQLITHTGKPAMPEDGAKLEPRNIDAIARWIDLGAPYDKPLGEVGTDPVAWTQKTIDSDAKSFWAFQPLKKIEVPKLEQDNWSTNEIDKFVLAKLREKKLHPNDPIEKSKLARRIYLSVIGLPPDPQAL
ncbi:MAG: c-type cytochrome domain-containing protein, partial [Planctomycetota bacterium]|nr:c-type cytochrome domain-containing protein [Planctomycetota bacterium]